MMKLHITVIAIALCTQGCNRHEKEQPFMSIAFSPDGKHLAAGRGTFVNPRGNQGKGTGDVVLWSTESWESLRILNNNLSGGVNGIAYVGDEIIAVADAHKVVDGSLPPWDGKRIYRWNALSGEATGTIELKNLGAFGNYPNAIATGSVRRMAVAPKSRLAALALTGDRPLIVDLNAGKPLYVPEGHEARDSTCLVFSPDEKTLISCVWLFHNEKDPRRPLRSFSAGTGKLLAESDAGGMRPFSAAFAPDGSKVVAGCNDGELVVLPSNLSKVEAVIPVVEPVADRLRPVGTGTWPLTRSAIVAVAISSKGDCAAATRDSIRLIDLKNKKVAVLLGEKIRDVRGIAFSPDGKLLAAAYGTQEVPERGMPDGAKPAGGVLIWDVESGKLIKELN